MNVLCVIRASWWMGGPYLPSIPAEFPQDSSPAPPPPLLSTKTRRPEEICCGEGQTEGATWSATLQQGLIQR